MNIADLKVAVIMLDGCILDLNRLRYNYYKHLCESHDIEISKEEFYAKLGNMNTMYTNLPLRKIEKSSKLNNQIEKEMYIYLSHKPTYPREGLFELIDYFHQKNIKIAVISTHSTSYAVRYLKLINVYSHVDYILGSDTKIEPLPSTQILRAVGIQLECKGEEMLVISPFLSLNKVARKLNCTIFYYNDLVEAGKEEIETSDYVVNNFYEILNHLLLDSVYDKSIFIPILGMEDVETKEELDEVNEHLKEVYSEDPEILDIVEDTYQYTLSKLNKEELIEEKEPIIEEESEDNDYVPKHGQTLSLSKEETEELTDTWNKIIDLENKQEVEEIKEELEEKPEKTINPLLNKTLNILNLLVTAILVSIIMIVVGLIIMVIYKDYMTSFPYIKYLFTIYLGLVKLVMNNINFSGLSTMASQIVSIFIFNTIILFAGLTANYLIDSEKDE